ncbi:MAG: response regulator [Actinobacteria bacterium]|nr:response regulator [Actinomycetota bacterium]
MSMGKRKVLVIDDEPAMHRLVQIILEVEGFEIVGMGNQEEATKAVASGKPDLIILDIMMPEVDGFEILRMLKGDEETRDIPVIVLTVRNMEEDVRKAKSLGAEIYMTKPFQPSELVDAVHAALSADKA